MSSEQRQLEVGGSAGQKREAQAEDKRGRREKEEKAGTAYTTVKMIIWAQHPIVNALRSTQRGLKKKKEA